MTGAARSEAESVWDYPRPPLLVPCERRVRVELAGETVADSTAALRMLETAPQDGDFYGGWITSDIRGPFKGAAGTLGW